MTASAPSCATASRASGLRTVAVTCAPSACASWTAAVPTPPAAPWTSSRSPGRSWAWVMIASCAVVKTSGSPPASGNPTASGTGMSWRSWTTASSPCPPPPTMPMTRVALLEAHRAGAEAGDLAGHLEAGDVRRRAGRRRVAAGQLHLVGAVEARRADADEDLAGARLGVGMLFDEDLAVADRCGAHAPRLAAPGGTQTRRTRSAQRDPEARAAEPRVHVALQRAAVPVAARHRLGERAAAPRGSRPDLRHLLEDRPVLRRPHRGDRLAHLRLVTAGATVGPALEPRAGDGPRDGGAELVAVLRQLLALDRARIEARRHRDAAQHLAR